MGGLSTPQAQSRAGDGPPPPRRRLSDLFLFFVIPVSVAVVFIAVLLGERAEVESDLQIVSPSRARPAGTIAVRAFHFLELDRPEGPVLDDEAGRVELLDGRRVVAHARLVPSAAPGLEGVLEVPGSASGELVVRATAPLEPEGEAVVVSPVVVEREPEGPEPRGRLALPLQRYQLFPVEPEGEAIPPAHFVPRVVGGTCVPEVRCDLLVLVGEPAASIAVAESGMVTPVGPAAEPVETSGIVPLSIVTHGPDSELELVARRGGAIVARRTMRVPVALASFALRIGGPGAPGALVPAPASPRIAFDGAEADRGVIVDAFRDEIWERTGSVAPEDAAAGEVALPFDPLGPGIWRIQARTDPFSTDSGAVRMIRVRAEGEAEEAALRDLAAHASRAWADSLARAAVTADAPADLRAAFILASPEMDLQPQPIAMSGAMQAATGLDDKRVALRWIAAACVVLGGFLVMVMVMRRGLAAGAQARRIMLSAGDETADSAPTRRRMTLTVIAAVLAIALTFLAAGALILARTGL